MIRRFNPPTAPKPASPYSQGVAVPAGARTLHVSGQIGVAPDGTVLEGFEAQCAQAFANLFAVIEADGMTQADIVKITAFLTAPDQVATYRAIRTKVLTVEAASTLLIVAGLASPAFLFEIEATAAKVD